MLKKKGGLYVCGCMQDRFGMIHKHIWKLKLPFHIVWIFKKRFIVKLLLLVSTMLSYFKSSGYISVLAWLYLSLDMVISHCVLLEKWLSPFLETIFSQVCFPPASPAPSVFVDGTSSISPVNFGEPRAHLYVGVLALNLYLLSCLHSDV